MVVFTCNHCGDSIQKPKVEKHITFECKKKFMNASLCCIDCLKDFNRKTYVEHTKCISEEERYSGKGYVPKVSSNKGEKKQQSWIEIIQAVLDKPGVKGAQRGLLQDLRNFSNVPRKLPKFKNFVHSSVKGSKFPVAITEEVFKLIDDEFRASKAENTENKQSPSKNTDLKNLQENETQKVDDTDKSNESKKEEKTDKLKGIENTDDSEVTKTEEVNLDESGAFEVVKKKKKSKKKDNPENENPTPNAEQIENVQSKKSKKRQLEDNHEEELSMKSVSKKKHKKLKLQEIPENSADNSQIIENKKHNEPSTNELVPKLNSPEKAAVPNNIESSENLSKKEKKERKKRLKYEAELKSIQAEAKCENESPNQENCLDGDQKQDKKKKRKLNDIENEVVVSKKSKIAETETVIEQNGESNQVTKFSWEAVIRAILENADGEISVKKLTKKAIAEYQSCHSNEKPYEDVLKRFNKKINKLPFVKILKDKAKLSV